MGVASRIRNLLASLSMLCFSLLYKYSTADRYAAVGNNKYSKSITILLGLYIHFLFLSVMYLYFIELPLML